MGRRKVRVKNDRESKVSQRNERNGKENEEMIKERRSPSEGGEGKKKKKSATPLNEHSIPTERSSQALSPAHFTFTRTETIECRKLISHS